MRISLFALAAILFALPTPSAQSLPDWAAPSAKSAAAPPSPDLGSLVPCPPGQTDDGMGGCIPNPPTQVPIDGGLGLLALAGAGLAARRLRSSGPEKTAV